MVRVGATQERVGLMIAIYSLSGVNPRRHDVTNQLRELDWRIEE